MRRAGEPRTQPYLPFLSPANTSASYEFSIRTPGTPARWAQFKKELDRLWDEDVKEVIEGCSASKDIVAVALKVFYYWVCFAPLTRGSAAVAHTMMLALLRAGGKEFVGEQREGVQLDWEAILCSNVNDFVAEVEGWVRENVRDMEDGWEDVEEGVDIEHNLPHVWSRICALNQPQ